MSGSLKAVIGHNYSAILKAFLRTFRRHYNIKMKNDVKMNGLLHIFFYNLIKFQHFGRPANKDSPKTYGKTKGEWKIKSCIGNWHILVQFMAVIYSF
jgi:hypothetical protein